MNQLDIEANLRGIGHVIRDVQLSVPPFQRNYSWTAEQVEDYWFDLRMALTSSQPYYFMGTIVVSRDTLTSSIVIDGQQRLATTSLLIAAIRDAFSNGEDSNRAQALKDKYLTNWSLEKNIEIPRLNLNDADRDYFASAVIDNSLPEIDEKITSEVPRNKRPLLRDAYSLLSKHVNDEVESAGPHWTKKLLEWIDFLDRRAQVILVETASDGDAFMVFETLNDRGLPLAVADVIKNYLLSTSRGRLEEASALWLSAVDSIEEAHGDGELTRYIRHWWNSQRGATRERDLYSFISSAIRSESQALEALQNLERRAPAYAALSDSNHIFWETQTEIARQSASVLLALKLEQYRPLALAVLSELPPTEASKILEASVSWSLRSLFVGGAGGGTAERLYAEAAVRVSNGRSQNLDSVWADMRQLVPGDSEFVASFSSGKIRRLSTVKYVLNSLSARTRLPSPTADLVPFQVIPRTDPRGIWQGLFSNDQLADIAGRLGNYVLLERDDARSVPDTPNDRLDYVREKSARVNGLIVPWTTLAIGEVDKRQHEMAKIAVNIWSLFQTRSTKVG